MAESGCPALVADARHINTITTGDKRQGSKETDNEGTDDRPAAANPSSTTAAIPGPVPGTRITEAYARLPARDAYLWGWPMANIYNKRLAFGKALEPGLLGGVLPFAPLNRLAMLTDYIDPAERAVACPNQDVVYGGGPLALDVSTVVVQVPDFGNGFWVYQVADLRTDSFADLGAMYGTKQGFYLLAGPAWKGEVPAGIAKVFSLGNEHGLRCPTRVSGRYGRRQARHQGGHQPHRRVPARRVRREGEEARLVKRFASPAAGLWRGRNEVGLPRDVLRSAAAAAR